MDGKNVIKWSSIIVNTPLVIVNMTLVIVNMTLGKLRSNPPNSGAMVAKKCRCANDFDFFR